MKTHTDVVACGVVGRQWRVAHCAVGRQSPTARTAWPYIGAGCRPVDGMLGAGLANEATAKWPEWRVAHCAVGRQSPTARTAWPYTGAGCRLVDGMLGAGLAIEAKWPERRPGERVYGMKPMTLTV